MLLVLSAASMVAQPVSKDAAARVARAFWTSGAGGRQLAPAKAQPQLSYTERTGDEVQYYVFNNAAAEGFVIVAADERAPQVLGYSNGGGFDFSQVPDNMKWWLSLYKDQIHHAIQTDQPLEGSAKARRAAGVRSDITPLISTTWDQVSPYNSQLPSLGLAYTGEEALATGCVATAMAQIMNYHQYPTKGIGSKNYDITYTTPAKTINFAANFAATTYDWDNMVDHYYDLETTAQKAAVATLMYHCGVAVDMQYDRFSAGGSSAQTGKSATALVNNFGYDRGIAVQLRDYMTTDDWEAIIYDELKALRPIIYAGQSTVEGAKGGHAFVMDGYKQSDNTYHINWGWGGYCDGYFTITGTGALRPGASGAGGAGTNAEYTSQQMVITGIQPDKGNPVNENIVATSFSLPVTTIASGATLPLQLEVHNYSYITLAFYIGARLVNTVTGDEVVLPFKNQKFIEEPLTTYYAFTAESPLNIPANYLDAGTYTVTPVFQNQQGEWQDMVLASSITPQTLTVTAPAADLFLVSEPTFGNGNYVTTENHTINLKIKNQTADDIVTLLAVFIFPEGGGSSVDYFMQSGATFKAGETTEFNLSTLASNAVTEGNRYTIQVKDYTNNVTLLSAFNVYFDVVPKADIGYTLSTNEWGTLCLPFDADVPSGLTAYRVDSYSGTTLNYVAVDHIDMNTPYILNGTPGTYNFSGPSTPAGTYTQGLLVGTTADDATIPAGSYILQNQALNGFGFYRTDAERAAAQYHAYISLPAGATSAFFILDEATGIDHITPSTPIANGAIYNLQGQQLNSLQRGINIIGGKKVLVK